MILCYIAGAFVGIFEMRRHKIFASLGDYWLINMTFDMTNDDGSLQVTKAKVDEMSNNLN